MTVPVGLTNHRICHSPQTTLVLPSAWRALLRLGDDAADTETLGAIAAQIEDTTSAHGFTTAVTSRLTETRRAGASFAAMLAGDGDVPVAASLVVSALPDVATTVSQIEVDWIVNTAREFRRVSLPVGPALVSDAIRTIEVDDVSSADTYDWQIAIPHPISGGLLLAFSSPLVPIKDIFDEVFLTIASTVRWQHNWRSS